MRVLVCGGRYRATLEDDLVSAVGLMFFDAMSVKCDASSYARRAIDLVRAFDAERGASAPMDRATLEAAIQVVKDGKVKVTFGSYAEYDERTNEIIDDIVEKLARKL